MRNKRRQAGVNVRRAATIATALMIIVASACEGEHRDGRREKDHERDERGFSVYDLGSRWKDQTSTARQLSSLKGRTQVLALVYTNCTSTCPMTVAAMQQVEAKAGEGVGFVLVSLDPGRDSPARLAEYAKQHALSSRWTLLSGDERAVRELAATLGIKYRTVSPTEIVHTSILTILDADGRLVAQYSETDAVDRAIAALKRLAADPR